MKKLLILIIIRRSIFMTLTPEDAAKRNASMYKITHEKGTFSECIEEVAEDNLRDARVFPRELYLLNVARGIPHAQKACRIEYPGDKK